MNTPSNAVILILLSSFIGSFGAVFLKLGAEHMKGGLARLFSNYWLAVGVVLYLLSSIIYMMGIAQPGAQLTVLYPMVSIGYIWAMVWAKIFFKEPFTLSKGTGLLLIIFGVALINFGNA